MNIALIGYGKMGKAIEQIALNKGHKIVLKIDAKNSEDLNTQKLKEADVAIEFTSPQSAFTNVQLCLQAGLPTVCGSTGWLQHLPAAQQLATQHNTPFIYASNYSVGVNIFFAINEALATYMQQQPQYDVTLTEVHHTQKLDAPSGTAVTLAQGILDRLSRKQAWVNNTPPQANEIGITSQRIDPAPGTHHVQYTSAIDDIEIIHTAHNRDGFASGAVLAAEYIYKQQGGIYTMRNVLGL
jgi:4-hydroxy-tetrahydrodipicolinate reductase